MKNIFFSFHLVSSSPWPLYVGTSSLAMMTSLVYWFKFTDSKNFFFSFLILSFFSFVWWRDVIRESGFEGSHSMEVQNGLKVGMILFIFSEIMFFSAFFWTFFHSSLTPTMEIGLLWPPISIMPLNPFQVPLLNTAVLISSGITVTFSHHCLINNKKSMMSLFWTIFLGLYFTFLQLFEYSEANFNLSDSIYGSIFFISTGFHGLHVLVGTSMLIFCFFRLIKYHLSFSHHIGLEISIWYWHFVDVVWLFLFSMIYWWGE